MAHLGKLSVNKWHSRSCVAALSMGIIAHAWMLTTGSHGVWMTVAALAMLIVCVPCVPGMWMRPTARSAKKLMVMAMAMALFHAILIVMPSRTPGATGHMHGTAGPNQQMNSGTTSMLVIIAIEIVTAFLIATVLNAHRRTTAASPLPAAR